MSALSGKLPFAQNIASAMEFQNEALAQEFGWELPCQVQSVSSDGLQVTVSFQVQASQYSLPNITIPIASSQYVRAPIQPGDKGVTKKIDVDLTYIAGIQQGTANFSNVGNLASVLFFEPITNTSWQASPDINACWIYGPDGVILQDQAGNCIATISHDKTKGITLVVGSNNVTVNSSQASMAYGPNNVEVTSTQASMTFGANSVVVNASGVIITGSLSINGQAYTAHEHSAGTYVAGSNPVTGTSGTKV